jgi:predicted DCC family thiol-disulfide oxidoreductase YuxK
MTSADDKTWAGGKARPGELAVLYDGACDKCRASVDALRRFDNSGRLELLDFHDEASRTRFPRLSLEALMKELYVVDDQGRVWRGAGAINQILRHQHGLRSVLAWLWYVPGFAWLANRQYRRIAESRYDGQCHPPGFRGTPP